MKKVNVKKYADKKRDRSENAKRERIFETSKSIENIISGKNSVIARLETGESINRIWLAEGLRRDDRLQKLMDLASKQKVKYIFVNRRRLDEICGGDMHQGVAAETPPFNYADWHRIKEALAKKTGSRLILVLDSIEDPHNVGAIIRSAVAAGADVVVLPKHRAAQITDSVVRASAGNIEKIPIVVTTNITSFLKELKEDGFWVYGLAGEGKVHYGEINYPNKVALVTGNEGKGLGTLIKKNCDELVKIPMKNDVESLNASVSTALMLYKIQELRKEF